MDIPFNALQTLAGVGLIAAWGTLKPMLLSVSVITVVAVFTVMGATGRVSQWVIGKKQKQGGSEDE